ncbi:flavin reductase family protein [Deinococcus radiophilus]|uniref:Flavin reductase family protein n=1 Tax=Deinococcus radiophilus TaxID=32062 RepID=A0A3S0ICW3_9DEIO|nr:flavin reductase family protein [Deinococcus radiophilus]RTR30786.1 flavin reductase family protein [Deinococcus radiophilus]UFA51342.1 flavin reductase family protein [Deinococcus radiophilus]
MLSETSADFFGYYPGTVALVTAIYQGQRNVMAAGWHTALSSEPPLYGVAIGRERATYGLIAASGEFGVNFVPAKQARAIQGGGVLSLHDGADKFAALGLTPLPEQPLALREAYLAYHCRLTATLPVGDHDLFVGQVQRTHFDPAQYDERRLFVGQAAIYLGRSEYVTSGAARQSFPPQLYRPEEG